MLFQVNTSRKNSKTGTESDTGQSQTEVPSVIVSDDEKERRMSSESEAPISERAASSYHDSPVFSSPVDALRRVQFQIGNGVFILFSWTNASSGESY